MIEIGLIVGAFLFGRLYQFVRTSRSMTGLDRKR